jgi:hypothetical protein
MMIRLLRWIFCIRRKIDSAIFTYIVIVDNQKIFNQDLERLFIEMHTKSSKAIQMHYSLYQISLVIGLLGD